MPRQGTLGEFELKSSERRLLQPKRAFGSIAAWFRRAATSSVTPTRATYWVRRYRRVRSTRANRLRTSGMTAWAHNGTAGHRTANAGASSGPA